MFMNRNIVETRSEIKYLLCTDIDAASAIRAIRGRDDRANTLVFAFKCGANNLWFRAYGKAVHTIIALITCVCAYSQGAAHGQQAVKRAHRAKMSAPGAFAYQEIEQEYTQQNEPGQASTKDQTPVGH